MASHRQQMLLREVFLVRAMVERATKHWAMQMFEGSAQKG
jgi:hypothetical protein